MKLKDFGFLGTLPPGEPEKFTLFYDFDYPLPASYGHLFYLNLPRPAEQTVRACGA